MDPRLFFETILDEDFSKFKELYDRQSAEVKEAVDRVFDGEVFDDSVDAGIWLASK